MTDPALSDQAMRQRVHELLQNVRFDDGNYLWAYDYDGVSTVLGDNPTLVGQDNYDMQGSDGTYIVQGMIETGRNGGGFYGYDWEHPNTGQVEPKQSYVLNMPELGWVMGAGVYMTDIERTMAAVRADAKDALQTSIIIAVLIGLGVFIIIALMAIWLVRRLVRPINQTASAMRDIAQGRGDLTQRLEVTTDDEIGALAEQFNAFVERMQTTLINVRRSVYEVHHGASEMAQGSEELASRTEQAAANLQETSSSMEEITSTVNHSSESAQQANQLATSTVTVARQGGEAMTEVEQTMGNLSDSATRIGEIITMIDGIAFQTNILALNASVEAARAGEHGRGFAVVAQEVRDLASRSANASSEIRGLIDTATTYTRQGSETVQRAGTTMREIVDSVTRVTDVIAEISAGAREQSAGISQVNTAVTEMDTMTQQNSSMVQQTSSTAESMRDQAARLSELVDTFVLGDDDAQPAATRKAPAPLPSARKTPARPPAPASTADEWEEF
ncbi:methyl-accepting chemotaxis protein [Vreelandella subglaciescola]|nr:methyl-accepting chemotaxis protein [Halomonas subglaciescola]